MAFAGKKSAVKYSTIGDRTQLYGMIGSKILRIRLLYCILDDIYCSSSTSSF